MFALSGPVDGLNLKKSNLMPTSLLVLFMYLFIWEVMKRRKEEIMRKPLSSFRNKAIRILSAFL